MFTYRTIIGVNRFEINIADKLVHNFLFWVNESRPITHFKRVSWVAPTRNSTLYDSEMQHKLIGMKIMAYTDKNGFPELEEICVKLESFKTQGFIRA